MALAGAQVVGYYAAATLGHAAARASPYSVIAEGTRNRINSTPRSFGLRNLSRKRPFQTGYYPGTKKPRTESVLRLVAPPPPRSNMARFKPRRRFKRRPRKVRRRFKRRTRTRRRLSKMRPAQHKMSVRTVGQNLAPGSATGPEILAFAPFSYSIGTDFSQGVATDQFIGNVVYLRGVRFRGNFRMAVPGTTANDVHIRAWLFLSRYNMAVGANGTMLGVTTTDTVNPAAVQNQSNAHVFDSTLSTWSPFVGDDITTPFDMSNIVKIKRMYHLTLKSQGVAGTQPSKLVDWWFPLNMRWTIEDINEDALTAPFFGKFHTPYLYIQAYDGVGTFDATNRVQIDSAMTMYWRNIN
ncbi:capsid protein [Circoviridae sp.]|nr:capsid protein [Circoviridae sp.]